MIVGIEFPYDENENLKYAQHELYGWAVSSLLWTAKDSFFRLREKDLVRIDLIQRTKEKDSFDHRALQRAHDLIAAHFRSLHIEVEKGADPVDQWKKKWQHFFQKEIDSFSEKTEIVEEVLTAVAYANKELGREAERRLFRLLTARYGKFASTGWLIQLEHGEEDLFFEFREFLRSKGKLDLVSDAAGVAAVAHSGQKRKGTNIPYITHPYGAARLLFDVSCRDEIAIAALLHDTVEDGDLTIGYIGKHFGETVASIVQGCSEPNKNLPWEERKQHTIEYLLQAPIDVRLVSCADKLDNIRAMAADYLQVGDRLWERFNRGREEQRWYYSELVNSFLAFSDHRAFVVLRDAFKEEVESLFPPD